MQIIPHNIPLCLYLRPDEAGWMRDSVDALTVIVISGSDLWCKMKHSLNTFMSGLRVYRTWIFIEQTYSKLCYTMNDCNPNKAGRGVGGKMISYLPPLKTH